MSSWRKSRINEIALNADDPNSLGVTIRTCEPNSGIDQLLALAIADNGVTILRDGKAAVALLTVSTLVELLRS